MDKGNKILIELQDAFLNEGCFLFVEEKEKYEKYLETFIDRYPEVILDKDFYHFLKTYDIISFHFETFSSSLWGAGAIDDVNPIRKNDVKVICIGDFYWIDDQYDLGFYFVLDKKIHIYPSCLKNWKKR